MRTRIIMILLSAFLATAPAAQQITDSTRNAKPQLGVVATAHLDTQWRWTIKNSIEEFIPLTLRDNFRLIEKYPDYVFSFEGSFRYQLAKEYYPEEYAKLKEYIAAGRWRVCGSWVDAVDVNIPSFESLVRHALYGNGFHKREFGKQSYDIFMPDCFGFGYALPSIAKHCGLKSFSTQKLTWGCSVPVPFDIGIWEGVDGSTVYAALNPGDYVGRIKGDLSKDTTWQRKLDEQGKATGLHAGYMYFGTGDTGGAPESLSVDWLQQSIDSDGPIEVTSIGADDLTALIEQYPDAQVPRYKGELVMTRHGIGCYTSQAAMKRWNRKNEQLADAAERAAVTAHLLGGYSYPKETFREAWTRFLWHQFHDDLTGTSIPEAYEYSWSDELLSLNQFGNILHDAVSAVTPALDTRGKGKTVVVYNPLAIDREEVVEAAVAFEKGQIDLVQVFGPDGKEVPSQVIQKNGNNLSLSFLAKVPSVGFSVYDIRPAKQAVAGSRITATEQGLENNRYKVALNANGDVSSIYDKVAQKELLAAPIEWQLIFNKPRQWAAWEIQFEDLEAGPRAIVSGTPKIEIVESGPVCGAIRVTRKHEKSTYETIIRLVAGSDRVEFVNKVDWAEKETLLKAAFKFTTPNENVAYDLGLGAIERGINTSKKYEVPGHMWADMTAKDGSYGIAVMNDCKYGWDHPDESTLRLTLIHTPGVFENWSWVGDQSSQDIGTHYFTFAVLGHSGSWQKSRNAFEAAELNQPLVAYIVPQHAGSLGKSHSLMKLAGNDHVMVNAVKMAEDSDELIIRVKELSGSPADNVSLQFARPIVSAREVNGQEEEVAPANLADGSLTISLTPFQPKAFAVRLADAKKPGVPALTSQPVSLPYNLDGVSLDDNRTDGNMDGAGNTLAGELLPDVLMYDGVRFDFGSKAAGEVNMVACEGQRITLPDEKWSNVYLLVMATGGPVSSSVAVETSSKTINHPLTVYEYTEPMGQWNNRMVGSRMVSEVSEILPAFVNPGKVAWAGTHRHTADGKNDTYKFTYLFAEKIAFEGKAKAIVLPNEPRLKVLAVSLSGGERDRIAETGARSEAHGALFARIAASETAFIDSVEVTLSTPMPGAVVHYTLDGSTPTSASPQYTGPFSLSRTTSIRASAFLAASGSDVSGGPVTNLTVQKLVPRESDQLSDIQPGLHCRYYEGTWQKLPKFDSLPPVKQLVVDTVAIPSVARPEDYGLVMTGFVRVPVDGMYEFAINSDDGSSLRVGDTLLVDNDGIHGDGEVVGKIALKAGLHPIEVRYFQCKGGLALGLQVAGPDMPKQPVGKEMLFHQPRPKS